MIKKIDIGHDQVLAFRVEGELDVQDMKASQKVIKPELESAAPFNLYLEMAATEGVEPAAVQERVSFILSNFSDVLDKVKKIALVTDKDWLQHLMSGVFTMVPSIEQRSFSFDEKEAARRWVA
ncbi:STAS/SEC14 domain-containing protein [Pontibacter sp. FD36]|uniref:STAS/SEC14 domain-containing protein n=1 Tax=Pontibacter sp. FD36 TaxID=2789860 RepID=UPI0018A9F223|nr:STAS/SEC14 domain-containing protein [Pontibacter sp. FD36]MBF8962128.1 STAS/SEC14 domain-containing protein [Pontibacter sp. FD36]